MMEASDFDGTHKVHSIAELEQLLGVRPKNRKNHYWLRSDGSKYPYLAIMVKGDLSAVYYFPGGGHAGFVSRGERLNLDLDKKTTFSITRSPADDVYIRNEFVISFTEAREIAKELFNSQNLPRSIHWFEL